METVLFVPGSGEDLHSRNYAAVLNTFKAKGYKAKFVRITWSRRTINDWAAELMAEYKKYDPSKTVLCGFSWGAMAAFTVASKRPPAKLWLCSLSPYFSEDLPPKAESNKKIIQEIGVRRLRAFSKLGFTEMAKHISSRTIVFMGEKEAVKFPDLKYRCEKAAQDIAHAQLVVVPNVGHEIEHPEYIAAMRQII